ncbi:MAG: phosphatidate cytidylyltransferase [Actinomycetota bacterium]|nr:phosphatidate cytidylyltransferase [Actinomycetota bacterium]MDQ3574900.1 phosphatidate cytidylyltransferase [Actinomycetota bacterium]
MDEYDDEMTDEQGPPSRDQRPKGEGVRIIGADEAARALEHGQVAGRRPSDAPRYGDVPRRPQGPRPAQRFPLPESVDPAEVRRPPLAGGQVEPTVQPKAPPAERPRATDAPENAPQDIVAFPQSTGPEMPHWTEPATGEVPRILESEAPEEDPDAWSSSAGRGPRWRDSESDWAESDFEGLSLEDVEPRTGALDTSRTEHSDLFSFDEPEVVAAPEPEPAPRAATTPITTRQPSEPASRSGPSGEGRDTKTAGLVGLGLLVGALVLFKLGPPFALGLATLVVTLAAVEVYDVLRRAGYRPATLLGLVATASVMLATYARGEMALPIVLWIVVVSTFCWYLFGVVQARASVNIAVTLLGFLWVGLLGSFAALLLRFPDREGVAFLLGAVIATVANDLGAWFFGSQFGRRPLMPDISPNKTVEGVAGGVLSSVLLTAFVLGVFPGVHPWTAGKAVILALVVTAVGTLGDLCESMVKRDLGIKDMGTLLPGHGGVMDRFDAMLFALPATYFVVKLLNLG